MSRVAATAVLVCTLGLLTPLAQSGRVLVTPVTIAPQLSGQLDQVRLKPDATHEPSAHLL